MKDQSLPENDNGENGECVQYFADANRHGRLGAARRREVLAQVSREEIGLKLGNAIWWAVNGLPTKDVAR